MLWLKKGASVTAAVKLLEENATAIGLGEIYYGPTLALNYGIGGLDPGQDPRTPDIIVTPNVGVTYSGSTTMIGDHGGFAHDDNNVVMLVAHLVLQATDRLRRSDNHASGADNRKGIGTGSEGA